MKPSVVGYGYFLELPNVEGIHILVWSIKHGEIKRNQTQPVDCV